jgi:hypothetical protein
LPSILSTDARQLNERARVERVDVVDAPHRSAHTDARAGDNVGVQFLRCAIGI